MQLVEIDMVHAQAHVVDAMVFGAEGKDIDVMGGVDGVLVTGGEEGPLPRLKLLDKFGREGMARAVGSPCRIEERSSGLSFVSPTGVVAA